MSKKVGSDGQIRRTTAEWAADTATYPEGMRLMDVTDGTVRVSKGTTYALAWTPATGGGGETPVGIPYTFSATTSASGIGSGEVRVNNDTVGLITAIYIAQNDATFTDFGPVLTTLSAGGLVYLNTVADDTIVAVMKVTAAVDSGTYYTLTGTYLSGVMPGDGSEIRVTVAPTEVTGVKRWVGVLTNSPVDILQTPIETGFGAIEWVYEGLGRIRFPLATATPGKVFVSVCNGLEESASWVRADVADSYGIVLYGYDATHTMADNTIISAFVSIMVYP